MCTCTHTHTHILGENIVSFTGSASCNTRARKTESERAQTSILPAVQNTPPCRRAERLQKLNQKGVYYAIKRKRDRQRESES